MSVLPTASADAPDECLSGRNNRMYNLGVRKGRNLAQQAFHSTDVDADCDNVDAFQEAILDAIDTVSLATPPSTASLCHFKGTIDGLLAELEDIQDECGLGGPSCFLEGEFIGQVSAQLYCELSIALGGLAYPDEEFLPGPVDDCDADFEAGCQQAFGVTANADAECVEFTEHPFDGVFEDTRDNQCVANPLPSEDP
jgi:hypothetical protein